MAIANHFDQKASATSGARRAPKRLASAASHRLAHPALAGWINIAPLIILFAACGISAETHTLSGDEVSSQYRIAFFGVPYLLASFLALRHMPALVKTCLRMWPYFAMAGYALCSGLWSEFPTKAVVNSVHYIGLFMVAFTASLYGLKRQTAFLTPMVLLTTVFIFLSIIAAIALPDIGIESATDPFAPPLAGRWKGIATHPNTLGMYCMTAIWASVLTALSTTSRTLKFLAIASTMQAAAVLVFGCQSMTSALCTAAAVFVILFVKSNSKALNKALLTKALIAIPVMIVIAIILLALNFNIFDPKEMLAAIGRDSTLTGRHELWELAAQFISEKPLTGWSFDGMESAFLAHRLPSNFGQMHNGYLDLTVRGGFIAAAILACILIRAGFTSVKLMTYSSMAGASILSIYLAIVLHNYAEASFFREGSPLWIVFVTAWVFGELYLQMAACPISKTGSSERAAGLN